MRDVIHGTGQFQARSAEGRRELHEPKMASVMLTDIQAPSSWFSLTCCFSPLSPGFGWAIPNLSLSSWGWDFSFFSPRKSWASHKKWSPLFWMKHFSVTNVFRVTNSRILVFSLSSQDDGWLLILHLCNYSEPTKWSVLKVIMMAFLQPE